MAPQSRCMASTGNLACRGARSGAVFHIQSRRVFPLPSSPVLRFYFPGHPNAAALVFHLHLLISTLSAETERYCNTLQRSTPHDLAYSRLG